MFLAFKYRFDYCRPLRGNFMAGFSKPSYYVGDSHLIENQFQLIYMKGSEVSIVIMNIG